MAFKAKNGKMQRPVKAFQFEEVGGMLKRFKTEEDARTKSFREKLLNDKSVVDVFERKDGKIVQIFQDENPQDPRKEWDNLGRMFTSHKRYQLGDEQFDPEKFSGWEEAETYLRKEKGAVAVAPLYLYDHSGLRIKIGSFQGLLPQGHAEFDSGQVGFIYVTKDDVQKEYGKVTPETIAKAKKVMQGEVETYDQYLSGDVYGVKVTDPKTGKDDSVWGFYGLDEARRAGKEDF